MKCTKFIYHINLQFEFDLWALTSADTKLINKHVFLFIQYSLHYSYTYFDLYYLLWW
jgi:hypothetical protein